MGYAQDSVVGLTYQESGFAAASVGSLYFLKHVGENVSLEIPELIAEGKIGVFEEPDSLGGARTVAGDLNVEPRSIDIGFLCKGMFGAPTTVDSAPIYTHTFEPAQTDWDASFAKTPITYYKYLSQTGSTFLYYDLNVSELMFEVGAGELLKAKATFVGGNHSLVAAQTESYYTQSDEFTWDQASLSLGGSANAYIDQMSITVTDNMAAKHAINNSKYPQRIKRDGYRVASISGTIRFEDMTEYLIFFNQTYQALDVTFNNTVDLGTGNYESIRIQCPRVKYTEFKPNIEGEGEITVSFSGKAKYHTGSGTAITVTVVNSLPAY